MSTTTWVAGEADDYDEFDDPPDPAEQIAELEKRLAARDAEIERLKLRRNELEADRDAWRGRAFEAAATMAEAAALLDRSMPVDVTGDDLRAAAEKARGGK